MTKQTRFIVAKRVYWESMTLVAIRNEIDAVVKEHGELCQFDTYEDPYDNFTYPVINVYRLETDMEEQEREYTESYYKAQALAERQKLYETLN